MVHRDFTSQARRLGIYSALGFVFLSIVYGATLGVGMSLLASPSEPIRDPYFSVLEVLIIITMPLFVALMAYPPGAA